MSSELISKNGENFTIPLKPKDKISIGINGVIAKDIVVDNYATIQVKWWTSFNQKN